MNRRTTGCSCISTFVGILFLLHTWLCSGALRSKYANVHLLMKRNELSKIFGVERHSEVPRYTVTSPSFISNGLYSSKSTFARKRRAAEGESEQKSFGLGLNAFGRTFNLSLSPNKDLFAPNFKIEILRRNGTEVSKKSFEHCHFTGKVNGESGSAAISACGGLTGLFTSDEHDYFIHPVPLISGLEFDQEVENPHIVFRRSVKHRSRRSAPQGQGLFDNVMDKFTESSKTKSCGTKADPNIRFRREADDNAEAVSIDNNERFIEALVVVDQKMCNYHGEDAATQFTMAVLNMVSSLLRDASIGSNLINLIIVKLQLLTIDPAGLTINHHAQNTLNSFGTWASSHSDPDDNSDDHFDYAFLLTRYNICADKNQECDMLGLTEVGGMCTWPYSASVNEDNGLSLAFTMTHELGHSLGMNHDGQESSFICPDATYIMSTKSVGKESGFTWSRCSRNYLRQFLSKRESSCLLDLPGKLKRVDYEKVGSKAGILYDADKQCEMIFGTGSKFCKQKAEQICLRLWCTDPLKKDGNCLSTNYPAADATSCGVAKWCMRGRCISVEKPIAIDGGWSQWSTDYSTCSRTCGGGVQYKQRICNRPKPRFGGKHCEGEPRSYQLCNTKPCSDKSRNYRTRQCERLNTRLFGEKYFEWEFKPSRIPPCKLGCFIKNTQHGYDFGNVEDGTNCDQMDDSSLGDKCINGECVTVGCDGIIGSEAKFDRCGVCNGDGKSCGTADLRSDTPDSEGIADALRSLKELGFDMGSLYGKAELNLAARRSGIPHNPNDTMMLEFIWAKVKSGCSVSCGGGVETVVAHCRRQDDGSPVPDNRCDPRLKPNTQVYSCKRELCPATWQTSYWGDCSRTCNGGIKKRHVRCVQFGQQGIEYEVDESLCSGAKPPNQEICNREACPPEWIAQPFGECSTVCDPGVQVRQVLCQKSQQDGTSATVKDTECSKDTKPPTEQKCNVHNPCPGTGNCGGIFTNTTGRFSSPLFPGNYPNNMECVYIIQVPEDKKIELRFDSLKIASPGSKECKTDFVKVMDGDCVSRLGESKFCGNDIPSKFESTTNRLCVKFFSDDSKNDQGFSASYNAISFNSQQIDLCDSVLTSPAGMISSPNYPEFYPSNEDCNITIVTEDSPIRLNFEAFDVGSADCSNDYVFIRGGEESKKYCGKKTLPPYTAKGNKLFIRFFSTSHPGPTKSGFIATYTAGNGQNIGADADKGNEVKEPKEKSTKSKQQVTRDQIPHVSVQLPKPAGVTFIKADSTSDGINKELVLDRKAPSGVVFSRKMHIPLTNNGPLWIPEPADQGTNFMVAPEMPLNVSPKQSISLSQKASTKHDNTKKTLPSTTVSNRLTLQRQPTASVRFVKKTVVAKAEHKKGSKKISQEKQMKIVHNLDGRMGDCPNPEKLRCIKLLLSYACKEDSDCGTGLSCCPTKCEYGPKMCVQKVTRHCPLRDPYYFPNIACKSELDCPGRAPCCRDMAGARYCRPPKVKILNRLQDE
ncbi:A disintegrin and metalloproteinase with thrombospondin motifs 6-like [Rhopilema esculentum]|uniref:A disintegrin and metalloproteinase with thrombospondin motifs 6-like n=1 Tax=Rhopilema esculentum TaxID=499914 RepID=UPI0031DF817B